LETYSQPQEIDPSRKKDIINLITHALQSGIAVDIMANTFKSWTDKQIIDWFPKYKKQSEREGEDCKTEEPNSNYPGKAIGSYITEKILQLDKHPGYPDKPCIINSTLLPIFCRLKSYPFFPSWKQDLTQRNIQQLVYSLIETGYFGYQDLEVIFETCDEKLSPYIEDMINNYTDYDFYNEFHITAIRDNHELDEDQLIFLEVIFYLTRISTQYKGDKFTTVPKEVLPEVFCTQSDKNLTCYLFSICGIISEQYGKNSLYRLVVPERLCKESPYAAQVKALVKQIAN
jgi:hypothetical protein